MCKTILLLAYSFVTSLCRYLLSISVMTILTQYLSQHYSCLIKNFAELPQMLFLSLKEITFASVCRNRRLTIRLLPIFTKLLSRNILSVTNSIQSHVLRELNIVD